ncbi:MAG TPA: acyltransferase [Candidatus Coprenecus pullistercoris]|nr:acyltransferase [Candidatus Coprenecus pullistercoris]
MENKFDDLRPYTDAELPAALGRITEDGHFPDIASYIFPDRPVEEVRAFIRGIRSTLELQLRVMKPLTERIIHDTTDGFTFSGIEALDTSSAYLFVSNHRDIMLDSTLLQYALLTSGHNSSEITFGSNLMSSQLLIDIGKSNKMFKVIRGGNIKDLYNNSMHLSEYIRYTVTQKHSSIWIAQRGGRTKDGNDVTDKGIVNMFCMSRRDDMVLALSELNVVPLSISYEWEPCDVLKALELYVSRSGPYLKKPGEDLHSILTGITQRKGRVHMHFCAQLTEDELRAVPDMSRNGFCAAVAGMIDRRIRDGFMLRPNNFIAHDMLSSSHRFADRYSAQERKVFEEHLRALDGYPGYDSRTLRDIFLRIYAGPVDNRSSV